MPGLTLLHFPWPFRVFVAFALRDGIIPVAQDAVSLESWPL